ncbi:MAG: cation:proton antiporter [Candidatus Omnitrophica bacterium]|jgi:Kef-type K+ transport system membrane component KefB/mannitol/fructose-specific phosphotransferase system IIA component (Ntr-type)|nr:cation:proton antiporter [Candidatus Omnitrophota bacterium]MDD5079556.1 cation:proton antiporter [Candidatus Omnitrophota bacterium]
MQYLSEHHILIFLVQIFILLGLARGLGELFNRFKQPALTAEILVGILLGPTILGRFFPHLHQAIFPPDLLQSNMLQTVAWLGLLFFLMETGLKMDFSIAWRYRSEALTIALTDIIVPMTIAFTASYLLPAHYLVDPGQRVVFSLFMATAMTISAMPVTIRALNDLNLSKTDLGFLIMSALAVNEIIGWLIFTLILSFITSVNVDMVRIFLVFSVAVGFMIFCMTVGKNLVNRVITRIKTLNMSEPGSSLTFICLLGFFCGAVFQKIGINALMGFFVAGVMAGEARSLSVRTRQVISQMVYAIFVPLFFACIGLNVDFLKNFNLFLVFFVTVVSISGKFLGAWLGVNFTGLPRTNRLSIAIAHTPGGSIEIVIALLALQYNLISPVMFVAIVCGAILSSIIFGPWLKYSVTRRKEISILEFFSRETIIPELKSESRDNAIYELCALAAEQDNSPQSDTLYSGVMERENLMATAVEEGIALPHGRFASLRRPLVVFGRSVTGIDWDSPDGKPTHFVFLILTPAGDDEFQIQILRHIAKTMIEKDTRESIMRCGNAQGLWGILQIALTAKRVVRKPKTGHSPADK